MSKTEPSLFNMHEHALEKEYDTCPLCSAPLQIKNSQSGPFLGCTAYPSCEYSRPLVEHQVEIIKVLDDQPCPDCGSELAVKNGRYGMFIGCMAYPDCQFVVHDEQEQEPDLPACPSCSEGQLVKRNTKSGKAFYSCDQYPKCNYAVNGYPVPHSCERCHWPIMIRKGSSNKLMCPQKSCQHKINYDEVQ